VQLSSAETNINFSNQVENTLEFNIQNYLYFYDGGGVAAGDINNDGLPDLFFSGNNVPNRLYLNKGDFEFEDITEAAGILHIPNSWSTGVTMADVNGDSYLDIYVSKVNYLNKQGANQLYINNGDSTFTERAEKFGLDFEGYSTQAAFFDYDIDGDLDMFLLNHTFHSENTYGEAEVLRQQTHPKAGDRLFRNDGESFTDVTQQANIYSSALGYGLGIAVTDINRDGFPDIYVGNDFHEDDYFYINNGDGTFTESLYEMVGHTSNSSMGNDAGDINNDGLTDIVSLDMMPGSHEVMLRTGGPDMVVVSETKKRFGFGPKNNRNTLQVNRGIAQNGLPLFSETGLASGIAKTEWSWSALLADFNNSGFQDLYVTNGLPKRPNELDYVSALQRVRQQYSGDELNERAYSLIDRMSSVHVPNYMFRNNQDLTFKDVSDEWGFDTPSYSNGAVYTDLNDDGKLDIVVNNINREAFVYQNNLQVSDSLHYLKIRLIGEGKNTSGIGSKVFAYQNGQLMVREQIPTRGFQSSVDHTLHFGLGSNSRVDLLLIIWPNGQFQKIIDVDGNQTLEVYQSEASGEFDYERFNQPKGKKLFTNVTRELGVTHKHSENEFDDFSREPLIPYKLSTQGPPLAVGDVNGDNLDDYYFGGAKGFAGKLVLQNSDGSFTEGANETFLSDSDSEDVDAVFFDATGDGLNDLYVVSGGNEYSNQSFNLYDRLYVNTGDGVFRKSSNSIPAYSINSSVCKVADFDGDGDMDLFVGGHSVPWRYGVAPQSLLLKNNGLGVFSNVTEELAPEIELIGNVTTASWMEVPGKTLPDLIVAGEWMGVHYFENQDGRLIKKTDEYGLKNLEGLWQTMEVADLDGNSYPDIILGNFGINSLLEASENSPLKLYVNDFNDNGQTAPVLATTVNGTEKPVEQLDEILAQIPEVKE
ncbi:MAG: VCBS repeat-containing protein, partial [Balneolaceae bacterium]|nr:VCBS repeat-containing protein [Balneolaceae bacterium]